MPKERLDVLVVRRGLAESREQARRLIMAGEVRVNGQTATKSGHRWSEDIDIAVLTPPPFVSRGGQKLAAALDHFQLSVAGLVCLDVGSSTGGFTDCLLQRGAAKVIAIDVGKGQLHWRLRNDPRVVVLEGVNARYLEAEDLPLSPRFACIDVSFISLTKILPAAKNVLVAPATVVTLIKPQFEAGRHHVERGGVVRNPAIRSEVVERIRDFGTRELGLYWIGVHESPLRGPAGNVEFLACWSWR